MEQSKQDAVNNSAEISLKELLIKLGEWWRFLLGKWLIICICGIVGAGLGLTLALIKKKSYVAELTFVMEDSKSSSLSAYAGLASQFGIDLGAGSGDIGVFSGENMQGFLKTRLMVEKTLLSPVMVGGKQISLADLYLDFNKWQNNWKDKPIAGLHFPYGQDRKSFTLQQDSVLNIIQENIVKYNLEVAKPDKALSFVSVKVTSGDELFSKVFTETLVNKAIDFYVDTKTKRSKTSVDKLQATADSLEVLLNNKSYSLAVTQDMNINPVRQVSNVGTQKQQREKLMLETMYTEVVKNLEISKMSMAQETPLIQIVDTPILPLKVEKLGKLKALLIGGILAGFLCLAWLIGRRILREVMQAEN
ncbi:lipopolysaccharide biosynthesis protein [Chitinophaga filiformis]|uniref:lipopolysaccharide biosynthesis protein n=1 Tax=Chitinophaga filiformis TaxID=104663 RepID=UPI001F15F1A2|nr:lipopolysaccharide biosynthesis protein [Chitinophaga filiformis]MCF6402223.1 lipopolysaccharide biosynthesis protein [Chitinophaga filiformis]